MNNKAQDRQTFVWIAVAILVIILLFVFFSNGKTVEEHRKPADISKGEKGTGLDLSFYDCPESVLGQYEDSVPRDVLEQNCRKVSIPDWFASAEETDFAGFSIVKRVSPPQCTTGSRTECPGYSTNPDIQCFNQECVLGNVNTIPISVGVTNPSTSEIAFLNTAPTTVTPAAFDSALDKTPVDLQPGNSHSFLASGIIITSFEGTTQTFSVSIEGTNEFTGETITAGDSIDLVFEADPTGSLSVNVQSPAP